jgi:hypothetical protein
MNILKALKHFAPWIVFILIVIGTYFALNNLVLGAMELANLLQ